MIRAFLTSFIFGLVIIWAAHSHYQLQQSYNRCQAIIEQIHQHANNLGEF